MDHFLMPAPMTYMIRIETQDEPGTDFELGPFETLEVADEWKQRLVLRYERDPDFVVIMNVDHAGKTFGEFPYCLGDPREKRILDYMDGFYDPLGNLDVEIADEVYGPDAHGRQRDEPCVYGHYDCAYFERGPCANETMSRRMAAEMARRGLEGYSSSEVR